jgi:hypothetical protein
VVWLRRSKWRVRGRRSGDVRLCARITSPPKSPLIYHRNCYELAQRYLCTMHVTESSFCWVLCNALTTICSRPSRRLLAVGPTSVWSRKKSFSSSSICSVRQLTTAASQAFRALQRCESGVPLRLMFWTLQRKRLASRSAAMQYGCESRAGGAFEIW